MSGSGAPPLASVIVVNWNGESYLAECVDSLLAQTYPRLEIIVVDNGSTDGSVRLLTKRYGAKIRLVLSPANLGFTGGNNLGMAAAGGAYVLLLNNDAVADPEWVHALVRDAEADSRIGMCASKIVSYDDPSVIDSAGLLLARDGLARGRGRLARDESRFSRPEDVLMPSGCAGLYRRAMLDEVGVFDERFFMYCDDVDLGLRGRVAGWRCRYVPSAVVRHRYSLSAGKYSPRKIFLVERNRVWVMLKSFPWTLIALSLPWTALRLWWHAYAAWRGRGGAGRAAEHVSAATLVATVLRAYAAALGGAFAALRQRRARASVVEFARWLRYDGVSARDVAMTE
ncbi:MAG TPA: glycosyltransferase family 2 protein [Nitrospiria bacterium]|nr:glycosyltransferase family 2 protein [Nitrospiria bacterium]